MSKKLFVPLGITVDYCPDWTESLWNEAGSEVRRKRSWPCIREFVQNLLDGEREKGAPGRVEYKNRTLTLVNTGALLLREAMMLGRSSKRSNEDLIGEHGEGMKIGALAGFRAGYEISILTGEEVWTPAVQHYEGYGAETFGFLVSPHRSTGTDEVRVVVKGLDPEDWAAWQDRFLNLPGCGRRASKVSCDDGDLLTDPAYAGRIYVKGVYVVERKGLQRGYNFRRLKLDRDRQVVQDADVNAAIARIFSAVAVEDMGWSRQIYGLLAKGIGAAEGSPEAENAEGNRLAYATYSFHAELRQEIAAQFLREHGETAVAVANHEEAAVAKQAGLNPVYCAPALRNAVSSVLGSAQQQFDRMTKEVSVVHEDLTEPEMGALKRIFGYLDLGHRGFKSTELEIVTFRLKHVHALASEPGDQVPYIRISRKVLSQVPMAVVAVAQAMGRRSDRLVETLLQEAIAREENRHAQDAAVAAVAADVEPAKEAA